MKNFNEWLKANDLFNELSSELLLRAANQAQSLSYQNPRNDDVKAQAKNLYQGALQRIPPLKFRKISNMTTPAFLIKPLKITPHAKDKDSFVLEADYFSPTPMQLGGSNSKQSYRIDLNKHMIGYDFNPGAENFKVESNYARTLIELINKVVQQMPDNPESPKRMYSVKDLPVYNEKREEEQRAQGFTS